MRIFSLVVAVLALAAGTAAAQSWQPPAESSRCPSKWGPQDERGSGNHMRPDTVMRAARLIQTGQVFELGHVLSPTMPFFPGRRFDLLTKRTNVNPGLNHRGSNEEIVFTELGQVGTQFDGFSHQTIGDRLYNCFSLAEISSRTGFSKLGIEHVGALMTRGVLIDVAALKGAEMLPDGYEITAEDLQQALQREKLTLQPGDAVIINTGWGRLWEVDNARYAKGVARDRRGRRGVARASRPDAGRLRQHGGRSQPESRHPAVAARSSDHAGRQRDPHRRGVEARRGCCRARVRVRVRRAAAEDSRRDGLDHRADRDSVNRIKERR